ncbi:MAG: putative peptidoglycan binding domain-containing protein [Acidimicrobiia bacterium]
MRRNVLLGGVIAAVVLAAGLGWFFGSQIQSPAEAAAEAEPPDASNITVQVVSEVLSADVITRGDIVYDEPVSVSLSGSFAETPEKLVVTQAVEVSSELVEGAVAVEVVGRPVFLLAGEIPMYRDLRPGATGDDVLQVEEALARMGLYGGVPDNLWDQETSAAVAAWYETAGYRPNGLSEEDDVALRAARDRVTAGQTAVADAEQALRDTNAGSGQAAVAAAQAEIDAARDAWGLANIDADRANLQAARAVTSAEQQLAVAQQDLANGLPGAQAAVAEAATALEQAQFDATRTATEQQALVDSAIARLTVAQATLADLQQGVDTSSMRRQIDAAREEVAVARDELAALEAELGTWLPAGEVVFLNAMPVRVDQVAVTRGSVIDGAFITVSGSELALRSSVSDRDAPRVEVGMEVEIENPETGGVIPGVIGFKADRAGTDGVAPDRIYLEITPSELPPEIIGTNVRVTIPVSSTGGEVLAVPAAALSATATGDTILQVEEDSTLRTVTVEPGLAAGGLVEVTPIEGDLAEGDWVVVGREGASDSTGDDETGSTTPAETTDTTEPTDTTDGEA